MNIIIWNCRGALKPSFCSIVQDMVRVYSPSIMIVTETKVGGIRAKNIIDRLPFDGVLYTNTIGYSGGLWVLWDSAQVEITELSSTEQEIHSTVKILSSEYYWLLSAMYASPRIAERRMLWENLTTVSSLHSLPWILAEDFNEVHLGDDKFRGRPINSYRALKFQECLNSCRMIDLRFSGPRFTWSNNRPLSQLGQERIDRVFATPDWSNLYPEAHVKHLERSHSDHCPMVLSLQSSSNIRLPRPFRFQPIWLSDLSFPDVVRDAWAPPATLNVAVERFAIKAAA